MPECRYVHISGKKCRAVAINSGALCHRHNSMRQSLSSGSARQLSNDTSTNTYDYGAIPVTVPPTYDQTLILPAIDDTASIQLAISRVLQALAANTIDPKRAGLLLYGLQIAQSTTAAMERRITSEYQFAPTVLYQDDGIPLSPPEEEEEDIEDEEDEDEDDQFEEDEPEEEEETELEETENEEDNLEDSTSPAIGGLTFAQSASRLKQLLRQIDHS